MEQLIEKAYHIIMQELHLLFESSVKILPRIALALFTILLFYQLARFARKLTKKIFSRLFDNITLINAFSSFIYYCLLFGGIYTALSTLQLSKAATSLLAGAGFIGLAMSFAFQDLATNLISGFFITIQKPFHLNDLIETNGFLGKVQQIGVRTVSILDNDGQLIIIPSKEIFQNPMINYSVVKKRRISLDVGVSYAEDLEKVRDITLETVAKIPELLKSEEIFLHYNSFGDSSINFTLKFWIERTEQRAYNEAMSNAIILIKKVYDEHNISIPFPIRTLDFGIKGGEKLNEIYNLKPVS